ncbi:FIG138576: 3-oxoacyl-[ACP] synthase [hydrothermal vent metagenome]|uniref:FIG138576: 3-oxoacyl-[ACP] synthase n=1 Tax=hydrothermal vent metagenome TaxID=652676 RepID=A0A3B1A6N0_9ZZZZ
MSRRVVITGMSGITAHGTHWNEIKSKLQTGKNTVMYMQDWDRFPDLQTKLAAPILDFEQPEHYTRKQVRSMGRVALMSTRATELALAEAGLLNDPEIKSGNTGIAYGSSSGSTDAFKDFGAMLIKDAASYMKSTSYIRMMSHTAPVNIGVFFGVTGRIIATSTACTSGSQGVGYSYEAIKFGQQDIMIAGGAEELCPTQAAVFDTLFATSTQNDNPELSPRPYDKDRDGLVIGEGACTLILEELEHAKARGAKIIAEVVGFGTNTDGAHVTQPKAETMGGAMQLALDDANLPTSEIGYVSGHGTATDRGDVAESLATEHVMGNKIPLSSLKSYYGHTLGACGSVEAWLSIEMMNCDWYAPTINLTEVDSECGEVDYITGAGREMNNEYIMSNNFAFGGINTSLIFKRWS